MESASKQARASKRETQRRGGNARSINKASAAATERRKNTRNKYVWRDSSIDLTLIYQDLPATRVCARLAESAINQVESNLVESSGNDLIASL